MKFTHTQQQHTTTGKKPPTLMQVGFITEVQYDDDDKPGSRAISKVTVWAAADGEVRPRTVTRERIVQVIKKGLIFYTLYRDWLSDTYFAKVILYPQDTRFITTENNKTEKDNLGNLPPIGCPTSVKIRSLEEFKRYYQAIQPTRN